MLPVSRASKRTCRRVTGVKSTTIGPTTARLIFCCFPSSPSVHTDSSQAPSYLASSCLPSLPSAVLLLVCCFPLVLRYVRPTVLSVARILQAFAIAQLSLHCRCIFLLRIGRAADTIGGGVGAEPTVHPDAKLRDSKATERTAGRYDSMEPRHRIALALPAAVSRTYLHPALHARVVRYATSSVDDHVPPVLFSHG